MGDWKMDGIGFVGVCGLSFRYTGFGGVFGALSAAAWLVTGLFSREYMKDDAHAKRYNFFSVLTLGAVTGIFYSADLFTLFFFFEIMSFASFMWVAHRQTPESLYAAGTYLGIAVAGGMAILMGILIVQNKLGTLRFGELYAAARAALADGGDASWLYAAAVCMFVGFGAKAGAFPVHVWLPDSYTQAPAPATALLSAILSKTGVFGLLIVTLEIMPAQGSWGLFILTTGVITMVYGGIRGVMSGNLKTTLAFSSMSQIGFVITGVGMQSLLSGLLAGAYGNGAHSGEIGKVLGMAMDGTFLHMVNHSLVKLALFMAAGVVFMRTGSCELEKVRGFGRKKPYLAVVFFLAAAGVGGVPFLNGYVSKTLLHESIVEYAGLLGEGSSLLSLMKIVERLFLFSGGLTVAYMTKLFVALFVEKNQDSALQVQYEAQKDYASILSKIAIGVCVLPIPFIGLLPGTVAERVARYGAFSVGEWQFEQGNVRYFSPEALSGASVSIAIGIAVYFLAVRLWMLRRGYRELFPSWINMEKYIYRAVFYTAIPFVLGVISRVMDSVADTIVVLLRRSVYRDRPLPYELPEGNIATHGAGRTLERFRMLGCAVSKREYTPGDYEHRLALMNTDIFENLRIIERSLSFGLFMFCVGLGLTMVYLLVVN